MIANKLISSSRHLLQRNVLSSRTTGVITRSRHVVAVPPRNKMPASELTVMAILLNISMWAVPFWVLYSVPDYQNEDRNQYTGK